MNVVFNVYHQNKTKQKKNNYITAVGMVILKLEK